MTELQCFLYFAWALISILIAYIVTTNKEEEVKTHESVKEETKDTSHYLKVTNSWVFDLFVLIQLLVCSFLIINKHLHLL